MGRCALPRTNTQAVKVTAQTQTVVPNTTGAA